MKFKRALFELVLASTVAVGMLIISDGNVFQKTHWSIGELYPPINKENVITVPFENS